MSAVNDFHNQAMNLAELALIERLRGNMEGASALFKQALDLELAAIEELDGPVEPTFSILHRSAGTMALHCNQVRLAEKIASKALANDPPEEIAEELRDLMEQVNFQRHLDLKGIALEEDESQWKPVEIRGTLRYADATRSDGDRIKIIDDGGRSHTVEVPEGMMRDIVRPMWDSVVTISGLLKGNVIQLQDIRQEATD